ncbi:MAG: CDP-diacylglycerol--glycerol-3-phosphate 3-phosphatidyltransferase [Rubrobacteridae bacterium]|nr:CDP-diacylglycerol--glycerol-3-phosphate 3-phosphatidyltransferase [Rubrobacteridae bacterium]
MGLANKITIIRILFIPVFMVFLLMPTIQPTGIYIAAVVFTIAAITDAIDGNVARSQKQVTVFGQLMDPLADKLLVSAALISLVELDKIPAWIAFLIIAREFAVSGLRLIALAESKIIPASTWGKVKTVSQIVAIIAIIIDIPIRLSGLSFGWLLMLIAVIMTIISGLDYFVKAKDVLSSPVKQ